jgi:UDP-2,4-diacetamido-2,4,6-trideoxy-beta-L-altropyranose hydrolase
MRCLTLANALRLQGSVCRFVCKEFSGHLKNRIQQDGFEVVCLPPALSEIGKDQEESNLPKHFPWLGGSWQDDAEQTIAAIGPNKPSWLIVDHYGIDSRWEKLIRPHVEKIMVIDDLADREHDCDLLLDQNLVANIDKRYEGLLPENSVQLLGPKYALLQTEYAELRKKAKVREGPVKRILVYFGGADQNNLTSKTLYALKPFEKNEIEVDVVINPQSQHREIIRRQIKEGRNITLHEGLPNLGVLMLKADLCIGGCGATTWERCCLGLPALISVVADNQELIAKFLGKNSIVRVNPEKNLIRSENIGSCLAENSWLSSASQKSLEIVDGNGLSRVIECLLNFSGKNLIARSADISDLNLTYQWASDLLVRENSFNSGSFTFLSHKDWFEKKLKNKENTKIYIIELNKGFPVGQVRFDKSNDHWLIDYSLDPSYRKIGLGFYLLNCGIRAFISDVGKSKLVAEIKKTNKSSCKIVEKLGFKKEEYKDKYYYVKEVV